MVNSPVAKGHRSRSTVVSLREQAELALAMADDGLLRAMMTDSVPAIARVGQIGSVRVQVGVPLEGMPHRGIDGLLQFEQLHCLLAGSRPDLPEAPDCKTHGEYQALTCFQSELYTLAQNVSFSESMALLSHAGFDRDQIQIILNLPCQAWHKSWWYMADCEGKLTIPFQRFIRTRRFGDGTFTFQYKDYYAQDRPVAFTAVSSKIPVFIWDAQADFGETLMLVNLARQFLKIEAVLLLADNLSELQAEAFIRQGVSLYTQQRVQHPLKANCRRCHCSNCPLSGADSSPVMVCRAYEGP